jgi:hypothetical protein
MIDETRGNRLRFEYLTTQLFERYHRSLKIDGLGLVATTLVVLYVAANTRDTWPGALIVILGVTAAGVGGWWWLADPEASAAFEVLMDHTAREGEEMAAEAGGPPPTSLRHAEWWLRDNPASPGRWVMLTRLGRFDDARVGLQAAATTTPEEAFLKEVMLRQLDVFDRRQVTTADLHAAWSTLPDTRAKGLRRWCLAVLDGLVSAADGRDPWPALALARPDAQIEDPSVRRARYVRTVVVFHVLAAITLWFIVAGVASAT